MPIVGSIRSSYQQRIAALIPELDPRHVEAYMRLKQVPMDRLTTSQFKTAVLEAAQAVRQAGPDDAELWAKAYGL